MVNETQISETKEKGYKWGYFQGITFIIGGSLYAIFWLLMLFEVPNEEKLITFYYFLLSIHLIGLGYFVCDRDRQAFIIATILSINPIIWIINYYYIGKRKYLHKK